jgi:hypothetical protein
VVKKKDTTAGGALDVNVILVGNNNVQASRTAKGQQNLDLLMKSFHDILNQTSSTIKLGAINAIEWPCAEGGDAYANVDLADLGTMITAGSSMVSASSQGRALNVYLVSTIGDSGSGSGLTILGIAGGIPGPFLNGKENSGLAFSSFNKLDTYNPNCTLSSCPTTSQEKSFIDMGATIAHEAGHYLGLNHLSESSGDVHDPVYDTPFCTTKSTTLDYITATSCSNESTAQPPSSDVCKTQCEAANGGLSYSPTNNRYCSAVAACGFNHLMWWLAKRTTPELSLGGGNVISTQSSSVLNRSPFIQ